MSMTLGKRGSAGSEMNVTPLIDVLLVLLIIFMVLPHHRGEQVEIPQPSNTIPFPLPEKTIVVQLNDAGGDKPPRVTINRKEVGWDKFSSALREIYEKRREKAMFLKGDPEVDFEYVAEAVSMARQAGVDRVGLLGSNQGPELGRR